MMFLLLPLRRIDDLLVLDLPGGAAFSNRIAYRG
jgi:hypothetical protein